MTCRNYKDSNFGVHKFYWNPADTIIYIERCLWLFSFHMHRWAGSCRNCKSPKAINTHSLSLYRKSLLIPALDTKHLGEFFFSFFLACFYFLFSPLSPDHNYPDNLQVETQTKRPNGFSLGSRVQEGINRNAGAFM